MLIKTEDKWDFTRSLINEWLAMPGKHCANCGASSKAEVELCDSEDCFVGSNIQIAQTCIRENREIRSTRKNQYNAMEGMSMRGILAIPPTLYRHLEQAWRLRYNRGFLSDSGEITTFAKKYPQFTICEVI
jgi:hypothetical protein